MLSPYVLVDLSEPPRKGNATMLIRCTGADKKIVDQAAGKLGMTQAQFIRSVVIRTAYKVLAEFKDADAVAEEMDKGARIEEVERAPAVDPPVSKEDQGMILDATLPPGARRK